jgi:2-polyprenyl-3-methyl-5-hydroxy-6-metoxy-1,4-benzoquinol methylase
MNAVTFIARNFVKAVRLIAGGHSAELRYQLRNKWKGVDFDFVSVEELRLPSDRAHFHSNSGGPTLARVFGTIDIPAGSVALDLGSGKGGDALTLSSAGFAEVIGVELSGELIEVARGNAARLRQRNVRFVQADAAAFREYDRVTHIYMYNPFPCEVMRHVMANIAASLARAPRPLTIVYRNPLCHDVIVASGLFDAGDERHPDEQPWRVYTSQRA